MGKDEMVKDQALQILGSSQALPRLVVFDLDYTLWPLYCECHSKREAPPLFSDAKGILYALKDKGIDMAIASRSPTPDIAKSFLNKLGIQSLFVAEEIYPSWTDKTEHFEKIQRKTQVPYNSMIFFDDEIRNIRAVNELGVTSVHVDGVNLGALQTGLTEFWKRNAGSSGGSQNI